MSIQYKCDCCNSTMLTPFNGSRVLIENRAPYPTSHSTMWFEIKPLKHLCSKCFYKLLDQFITLEECTINNYEKPT